MPNCSNYDAVPADTVENRVRSAADYQFANAGFGTSAAEIWVRPQRFNDRNDASGQAFGGVGLIECDIGTNLAKTCQSQRRPDDLNRHSDSSS